MFFPTIKGRSNTPHDGRSDIQICPYPLCPQGVPTLYIAVDEGGAFAGSHKSTGISHINPTYTDAALFEAYPRTDSRMYA